MKSEVQYSYMQEFCLFLISSWVVSFCVFSRHTYTHRIDIRAHFISTRENENRSFKPISFGLYIFAFWVIEACGILMPFQLTHLYLSFEGYYPYLESRSFMHVWSSELPSREILTFGNSHLSPSLSDNLMQVYCFLYWEKQMNWKMKIFHCKSQNNQWTIARKLFCNILTTLCFEDFILSILC